MMNLVHVYGMGIAEVLGEHAPGVVRVRFVRSGTQDTINTNHTYRWLCGDTNEIVTCCERYPHLWAEVERIANNRVLSPIFPAAERALTTRDWRSGKLKPEPPKTGY